MKRESVRKSWIIDARPRGPFGPFAASKVLGRTVLDHLLDAAAPTAEAPIVIHAREDEHDQIRSILDARPDRPPHRLAAGPPLEGCPTLRGDRLYDPVRLRRAISRGGSIESAVIWRLDGPHALAGADDELIRRRTYQPIGRYWALAPARSLARLLATTFVHPNHLTLTSGLLMSVGSALVALQVGFSGPVAAVCFAVALVIDTADGHLARLQGTASRFGGWLDANLDELGDMTLHAAVAWAAFASTANPAWLVLGMIYGMSKYLFFVGNATWDQSRPTSAEVPGAVPSLVGPGGWRGAAHLVGHADVRWHLWIILASIGRLDVELVAYSAYFAARALAGAVRKAGGVS